MGEIAYQCLLADEDWEMDDRELPAFVRRVTQDIHANPPRGSPFTTSIKRKGGNDGGTYTIHARRGLFSGFAVQLSWSSEDPSSICLLVDRDSRFMHLLMLLAGPYFVLSFIAGPAIMFATLPEGAPWPRGLALVLMAVASTVAGGLAFLILVVFGVLCSRLGGAWMGGRDFELIAERVRDIVDTA